MAQKLTYFMGWLMESDMNAFFRGKWKQIVGKNVVSADVETDISLSPKSAVESKVLHLQ